MKKFLAIALLFIFLGGTGTAFAEKLPLARDGVVDRAVYNGQQNMPVRLYGVSRKWNQNCFRGKAKECLRLAEAFETGLGDLKSSERIAAGYYLKGCETQSGPACAQYAMMTLGGSVPLKNPKPAIESAQTGCRQLRSQDACAWLGVAYHSGTGLAQNRQIAEQLWRSACTANSDDGCRFLANYLWQEKPQDRDGQFEALKIFGDSCEPGDQAWACLGQALMIEEGIKKGGILEAENEEEYRTFMDDAAFFLEFACLSGEGDRMAACAEYASRTIKLNDRKKVDVAEGLLSSSCRAGIARSCHAIGLHGFSANARLGKVTPGEAGYFLRRGCDLNHAQSCHDLAQAYLNGKMRQRRIPVATMLMLKACDLQLGAACNWVAKNNSQSQKQTILARWIDPSLPAADQVAQAIKIADQQPQKAARTADLLMEEQYDEAQWLLGNWFLTGKRGIVDQPNIRNAVILIQNAAMVGHVEAARWMGMAHWYGTNGVAFDRNKGLNYMAISARFGDQQSTLLLQSMRLQPERDRIAAQRRARAEQAKRQQSNWFLNWIRSIPNGGISSASRTGMTMSQRAAAQSWRRHQSQMDKLHFNNRMNYLRGNTTACPRSNPYC